MIEWLTECGSDAALQLDQSEFEGQLITVAVASAGKSKDPTKVARSQCSQHSAYSQHSAVSQHAASTQPAQCSYTEHGLGGAPLGATECQASEQGELSDLCLEQEEKL